MSSEFRFGARSRAALYGVHTDLILVVSRGLLYSTVDFAVTEGIRAIERQRLLVAKGLSRTMQSRHLVQSDGYGHAIDVMAAGDLDANGLVDAQDKAMAWDPEVYGEIALAMKRGAAELGVGIRWGGEFKTREGRPWFDGPHFELD